MMRGNVGLFVPLFCITVVIYLLMVHQSNRNESFIKYFNTFKSSEFSSNLSVWHSCFSENISSYRDDAKGLWSNMWKGIKKCEELPEVAGLKIEDFSNSDETKRHIVTKVDMPTVIVTLGIGHDTGAEQKLIKRVPKASEFFGADPMHEINEDLFTKLPGKYFPFAVGAESGISTASVLKDNKYQDQSVVMIDIIYFLKDILKRTFIDDLWLDAEGAEYGIFDHFRRGGKFDENGIVFCQLNVEIHSPSDKQKELIKDFIFGIVEDKRYMIFRPVQGNHIRLYFLNAESNECSFKYIL